VFGSPIFCLNWATSKCWSTGLLVEALACATGSLCELQEAKTAKKSAFRMMSFFIARGLILK
jgi:hypothetical protein